ncbi:MAG: hypothetical protein NVS4B8_13410 [Herpetosiphon sp.]
MDRLVRSALLLMLLLFLVPVYQARSTNEVLILSVALLAIGVFLAFGTQPRGLQILAALTVLVSLVGISFLGATFFGHNGGSCFLMLWILALLGAAATIWRRATFVERGQLVVVNQLPDNRVLVLTEGVHRPITPPFERLLAILPAYELIQQIDLETVNTASLFNVTSIHALVRYQIESARDLIVSFPNREQAFEALQRERGIARTNSDLVAFWTELVRRQMDHEVDEAVRATVAGIHQPADVARGRIEHGQRIKGDLQQSVKRWGIKVVELRLLEVVIDPERIRAANRDYFIEREQKDAERKAMISAQTVETVGTAQARVTARMVSEIAEALKQQGAELTPDEIERIIVTSMQRTTDTQQLSGFFRQLSGQQSGDPGPPRDTPPPVR